MSNKYHLFLDISEYFFSYIIASRSLTCLQNREYNEIKEMNI